MDNDTERRHDYNTIHEKLTVHDSSIDALSHSIDDLVSTNVLTNGKIDKLIDSIAVQNVLAEKVSNIDTNIRDSFKRRDDRLDALERVQSTEGCSRVTIANENIKSLGRSIDSLKDVVKDNKDDSAKRMMSIEEKVGTFVSGIAVRWAISLIVGIVVTIAGINISSNQDIKDSVDDTNKEVANLDKVTTAQSYAQHEVAENNSEKFSNITTAIGDVLNHHETDVDKISTRLHKLEIAK